MARKRKEVEIVDDLDGTVEGQARDFFAREKTAYEERTGEKCNYAPPTPETRTPIEVSDELGVESGETEFELSYSLIEGDE